MTTAPLAQPAALAVDDRPLLEVRDLCVSYRTGRAASWRKTATNVVDHVGFDIRPGETLALVGESGSGKSTIGRAILRLVAPAAGTITFDGREVTAFGRSTPLSYRRDVQAVFQDPASSLNPRHTVGDAVTGPLRRHGRGDRAAREDAAAEAFRMVGLDPALRLRYPMELSGGQRQRVAIARAIALRPRLVVCDEAVSALDVSTQSQIVNLLADLQESTGISFLFITHDLRLVRHIAQRTAVLESGRLVECAETEQLFRSTRKPYTRRLLAAIPATDPEGRERRRARRAAHRKAPPQGKQ